MNMLSKCHELWALRAYLGTTFAGTAARPWQRVSSDLPNLAFDRRRRVRWNNKRHNCAHQKVVTNVKLSIYRAFNVALLAAFRRRRRRLLSCVEAYSFGDISSCIVALAETS